MAVGKVYYVKCQKDDCKRTLILERGKVGRYPRKESKLWNFIMYIVLLIKRPAGKWGGGKKKNLR